jgi:hypothetical protein
MTPHELQFRGKTFKVPGVTWSEVILDLIDEPQLFQECEDWIINIQSNTVEKTSDIKVTVGEYVGLWPSICDKKNMRVTFLIDVFHLDKKDWRDWFLEGEEYASQ